MATKSGSRKRKKKKPAVDISQLAKVTPTTTPRTWRRASSTSIIAPPSEWEASVARADKVNWKKLLGFSAIIFLIVLGLYAWSLSAGYVFNDPINYSILTTSSSDSDFLGKLFLNAFQFPLTEQWVRLTYALDKISFPQGNVPYFHLVNITLHAVACIYLFLLVFQIVRRLQADERTKIDPYVAGLASALLFACHPLATGAVAYISGRGPVLAVCNYLLCP